MEKLIQELKNCEKLLRDVGEIFWTDKIKAVLNKSGGLLETHQLKEILSWYGGMGSFNDIMILACNGYSIDPMDEDKVNCEFKKVCSKIYDLAEGYLNAL